MKATVNTCNNGRSSPLGASTTVPLYHNATPLPQFYTFTQTNEAICWLFEVLGVETCPHLKKMRQKFDVKILPISFMWSTDLESARAPILSPIINK